MMLCEGCRRRIDSHSLTYCRRSDEYLCDECIDYAVEEIETLFDSHEERTNP